MESPLQRHARACRGHPRLSSGFSVRKVWMAGTSPGHDSREAVQIRLERALEKLPYSRNVYVPKTLTTSGSVQIRDENGNGFRQNSRRGAGVQPGRGKSTCGEDRIQPRSGSTAGRAAAAGRLYPYD